MSLDDKGVITGICVGQRTATPDHYRTLQNQGEGRMKLSTRSKEPEELDDDHVDPRTYKRVLQELDTINRLTLTHLPTLRWLDKATKGFARGSEFTVLDVGYGNGDLLRAIAIWADNKGFDVTLKGIDLNPKSQEMARAATPRGMNINFMRCDVFNYPGAADFIVSSQFTHHLSTGSVYLYLRWVEEHSIRGWHIVDLHRSAVAYYGFKALSKVMGWHRITRSDGLISVARSFRRHDWQSLLRHAQINARVTWHPGFRYSVSHIKN